MPNGTTTAVQHPPKAHLGLPTTKWLRPSSFDKLSCPYVGRKSCPTRRGQFHHNLKSITAIHCAICFTAAAPSPIQLQAKYVPRVTPPTARATCRKTDHTRNVYSNTIATSKTAASTPDKRCLNTASAMNRQLWLRQALSALNAETPSQKNRKIGNSEYLNPSANHNITIYRIINATHTGARAPTAALPSAAAP